MCCRVVFCFKWRPRLPSAHFKVWQQLTAKYLLSAGPLLSGNLCSTLSRQQHMLLGTCSLWFGSKRTFDCLQWLFQQRKKIFNTKMFSYFVLFFYFFAEKFHVTVTVLSLVLAAFVSICCLAFFFQTGTCSFVGFLVFHLNGLMLLLWSLVSLTSKPACKCLFLWFSCLYVVWFLFCFWTNEPPWKSTTYVSMHCPFQKTVFVTKCMHCC